MKEKGENNINESVPETPKKAGGEFEIAQTSELLDAARELGEVEGTILHDRQVTLGSLEKMKDAFSKIVLHVGGEDISLEMIMSDPELQKNVIIWKEIEEGNFMHYGDLTELPSMIAEKLVERFEDLAFFRLKRISDAAAKHLGKHDGYLSLGGITELSDNVAEHLSRHSGSLHFDDLGSLSETVASFLSRLGADTRLSFERLMRFTPQEAKYLVGYKGYLSINARISSISQEAIHYLALRQGGLEINDFWQEKIDAEKKRILDEKLKGDKMVL